MGTQSDDSLEEVRQGIQATYNEYLKTRTPAREFEKNQRAGVVCFYCWGSLVNGYCYPGLTQEDFDQWVRTERVVVRAYWKDDPVSILGPTEPFDQMLAFMEDYNRYVLEYLKSGHNQPPQRTPGEVPASSTESDPRRR